MYGDNSSGQLGVGKNYGFFNIPFKLERMSHKRVIECDGGYYHSIILTDDGEVWTAGASQYGKLGIGKDNNTKEKAHVLQSLKDCGEMARSVSSGGYHSAISTVSGQAYLFGHGSFGQCGQGSKLENFLAPVKVTLGGVGSAFITQAVTGGWHTLLLENSTALLIEHNMHKKLFEKLIDQTGNPHFDVSIHCYIHSTVNEIQKGDTIL
jgi:alpha-tubulin suppressor-like RCC1 family protein